MVENARPQMPSDGSELITLAVVSASAKIVFGTERPPMETVSRASSPEDEPVPYVMSHLAVETSLVDDCDVENFLCDVVALAEGTKRSADPVSKMTSVRTSDCQIPLRAPRHAVGLTEGLRWAADADRSVVCRVLAAGEVVRQAH